MSRAPKTPLPEKICKRPKCGVIFSPYRAWQEYCSPRCRGLNYWSNHNMVSNQVIKISSEQ